MLSVVIACEMPCGRIRRGGLIDAGWAESTGRCKKVLLARARKQVTIYTSDKEALREAIEQSEERLTTTELIAGGGPRGMILRQPVQSLTPRPERQKEPELACGY